MLFNGFCIAISCFGVSLACSQLKGKVILSQEHVTTFFFTFWASWESEQRISSWSWHFSVNMMLINGFQTGSASNPIVMSETLIFWSYKRNFGEIPSFGLLQLVRVNKGFWLDVTPDLFRTQEMQPFCQQMDFQRVGSKFHWNLGTAKCNQTLPKLLSRNLDQLLCKL